MKISLFILFLCLFQTILAQELTILSSETQTPLIGATVQLKRADGSAFYHTTDQDGKAFIKKTEFKNSLYLLAHISYIGYQKMTDTIQFFQNKTLLLQPMAFDIHDVVITAQYSPTSVENSVHKVKVISQQKIENMAAVNLQDVLTNELNVRLTQDNILGSGMSLQGISGQNVKILIDGVPVIGRLDGQIDLNQINLNDVERIEIIEGPLSVNYGSNALAGTINVITKKESPEKVSIGINSYNESIGRFNLETSLNSRLAKNHSVRLAVGRNYFDGWNAEDGFLPSFAAQRADSGRAQQWNPKEQYFGRIQYNLNYKRLLLSYKAELFDETITNYGFPRRSTNSFIAFDDYYHTQRIDNALFLQGQLHKNWSVNWTAAYNDFERIKEARRKDLVTLESTRVREEANNDTQDTSTFNLFMSRGSIATTKDSTWFNYEIGYDINLEQAAGKRIDGREQYIADYAAFITAEMSIFSKLLLKPAIRYSYNSEYHAPLTPAVNLKYKLKNSAIRFSYAKGFRAPSLKELYFNFDDINHSLFGNSQLKAEQSNNYSASIRHKLLIKTVLLKVELASFYNQIYNQISFAQSNIGGGDTLVYFNIGENQTKGLNLSFSMIYENWRINLGSSYIGRYNRLADENPIDEFSYALEFTGNATYELQKPQLTLAIFFKHQGELPGFGYNTEGKVVEQRIDSYRIMDVTISKPFWQKRIQTAFGVKNIFNVQNVEANLAGGAHSSGGNSISVGTGRTFFLKLGFQLSKM